MTSSQNNLEPLGHCDKKNSFTRGEHINDGMKYGLNKVMPGLEIKQQQV